MTYLHSSVYKTSNLSSVTSWLQKGGWAQCCWSIAGACLQLPLWMAQKAVWGWFLQHVIARNENIWGGASYVEVTKSQRLGRAEQKLSCSWCSLHVHFNWANMEKCFRLNMLMVGLRWAKEKDGFVSQWAVQQVVCIHLFGDCRWNSSEGQIGSMCQLHPTQTFVHRNEFHLVWPVKACEYLSPFS